MLRGEYCATHRIPQTGSILPSQTPTVSITTLSGGMKIMLVKPAPAVRNTASYLRKRKSSYYRSGRRTVSAHDDICMRELCYEALQAVCVVLVVRSHGYYGVVHEYGRQCAAYCIEYIVVPVSPVARAVEQRVSL